ncbi:hypothetical protein MRX96_047788 [Rhipicephalus microplus]
MGSPSCAIPGRGPRRTRQGVVAPLPTSAVGGYGGVNALEIEVPKSRKDHISQRSPPVNKWRRSPVPASDAPSTALELALSLPSLPPSPKGSRTQT